MTDREGARCIVGVVGQEFDPAAGLDAGAIAR